MNNESAATMGLQALLFAAPFLTEGVQIHSLRATTRAALQRQFLWKFRESTPAKPLQSNRTSLGALAGNQ
jgi:hypothetical protein